MRYLLPWPLLGQFRFEPRPLDSTTQQIFRLECDRTQLLNGELMELLSDDSRERNLDIHSETSLPSYDAKQGRLSPQKKGQKLAGKNG
jgi:hypothetical protein